MVSRDTKRRAGRPRRGERRDAKDVRHEILVAASHLFCQQGYAGTQLNQIAEAAGLRTPSLYHYFANKDEILDALLVHANDRPAAFASDILSQKGRAADKLRAILVGYVDWLTSGPFELWFLVTAMPRSVAPNSEFGQTYAKSAAAVERLIQQAVDEGDFRPVDPQFALHMIWGSVAGAMTYHQFNRVSVPSMVADHILRSLSIDSGSLSERYRQDAAE